MSARAWRLGLLVLALAAAVPHLGTLANELTFDDHWAIERSPLTREPVDVVAHLSAGFWGEEHERVNAAWRPLTTLTFAWNRAAHGVAPEGYHLVNLLLHALCAVLVALWARQLGLPAAAALAAGLLFAVHPVHVEAIAAGVGRADLLLGACAFAALLLWDQAVGDARSASGPPTVRLFPTGRTVPALAFFALALLAKEMAVTLAPVLVWRDLTARRGGRRWVWPFALVGLWLIGRYLALGGLNEAPGFLENPLVGAGALTRLWTAGDCYLRALRLLIQPGTLIADYSYATVPALAAPTISAVLGLVLLAATAAAVIATAPRAPVISTVLALWLLPYLLVSHLGPTVPMIFAERWLYLPSAGLCVLAAAGGAAVVAGRPANRARRLAALLLAGVAAVAIGFALRSATRVADWRDDRTLFLETALAAPRGIKPLCNAARALAAAGELEAALAAVEQALAVDDGVALPHLTAATLYTSAGDRERAARHLVRAAQLNPDVAALATARCAFAARFGAADAVGLCRAATEAPLAKPEVWALLGIALDQAGAPGDADRAFRRALALEPHPTPDLLYNYGVFLARQGRFPEARPLLTEALRRAPNRPDIQRAHDALPR